MTVNMSPYMERKKAELEPLFRQLEELNALEELSDDQKSEYDTIYQEALAKKADYDQAAERAQKAVQLGGVMESFSQLPSEPRARVDVAPAQQRGSSGRLIEVKRVSEYLTDSRQYAVAKATDNFNVQVSVPVAALFPFADYEAKAPFIPGNLDRAYGNIRIIAPAVTGRYPLLDLIRTVQYNDISVPYLPLTFTNNATEQTMGQPKAESSNSGDIQMLMMTTIAHWKETPRQILRYIPGLRPIIDSEMREGVLRRAEQRVLNGTGTGTPKQMLGILPQVTQTAVGDSLVAQIFDAIGRVEELGGVVDAIVMNPRDYAGLLYAEYASNRYNPLLAGERFGAYRIVRASAIAAGTALVGDFGQAVTLFVGEAANVRATEALGFKSNIVTILGEMDAVVLVERPWLLCKATGPLTPPNPNPATGATAGTPGSFTPAGADVPANLAAMSGKTASPTTAWTVGQYVHTTGGDVYWNGTAWASGRAPA